MLGPGFTYDNLSSKIKKLELQDLLGTNLIGILVSANKRIETALRTLLRVRHKVTFAQKKT